jgi:opacity protein-like surface antigen
MKRIILTAAAVFAFGFANAQDAKFGVKGGLNVANFEGDTGLDMKSKVGFHVGGFVAIKLSDKFTLQPEVLYSTQGAKADNIQQDINGTIYTADVDFNLDYVNVPLMVKYYAAEKFNIELGPQLGFLTSAKVKATVDGTSAEEDVKDQFESMEYGVNVGAGYDFTEKLSAGLRYNLGLSNIAKTEPGDDSKLTNTVFSVSLGYKF